MGNPWLAQSDNMNLFGQILFNLLLPGYGFIATGFPRTGLCILIVTMLFWIFAWPFAIPVHCAAWLSGLQLLHRHEAAKRPG